MRSLVTNKIMIFHSKHFFGVLLVAVFLLLSQPGQCEQQRDINPQTPIFQALEDYLKTANPEKKRIVMGATGSSEILATRIYKAFRQVLIPGFPDNYPNIKEIAWNELDKNPELTVALLWPVVKDNKGKSWVNEDFDSEEIISVYIVLCNNFAKAEVSSLAYEKLVKMSKGSHGLFAAKESSKVLDELKTKNIKVISERYRNHRKLDDLNWIYDNYLKYKRFDSLSLEKIKALLGDNYQKDTKEVIGQKIIFSGIESENRCQIAPSDKSSKSRRHLVIYLDSDNDLVYRCEWEEDGKVVGDPIVWEGV